MGAEEIRNMFQGFSSDIVVYGCYGEILYDKEDPFVDGIVPWTVATTWLKEVFHILSGYLVVFCPKCVSCPS
jgi:hypothetical protein